MNVRDSSIRNIYVSCSFFLQKKLRLWRTPILQWSDAFLAVFPLFIFTRLFFLLLTYLGITLFTLSNFSSTTLSGNALLYSWFRWDAVRLATIAANGYVSEDYSAFYPLFPLLERFCGPLLHLSYFLAGMLISNLAFLCFLVVLFHFVASEFDRATAWRSVLYLTLFPSSIFFFAAYNESIFLLFMFLSYLCMRRGKWWIAGIFGCIATLTRSIGVLLLLAFIYEQIRQRSVQSQRQQSATQRTLYTLLLKLSGFLPIFLFPLGIGLYALHLQSRFQDPLAFMHAQTHWREPLSPPWVSLLSATHNLSTLSPFSFFYVHNLIDLFAFLVFFVLLLLCFIGPERFPQKLLSLPLLGIAMLCFPLFFPGLFSLPLMSMQRFVIELPAAFILLASLGKRPAFHHVYLITALPLQTLLLFQFVTGYWTV